MCLPIRFSGVCLRSKIDVSFADEKGGATFNG
jgi:hypothetical protein